MLTAAVKKMFKLGGLLEIYKDFYAWLGTPELFTFAKPSVLEYSDVFPLVYLKLRLEGVKSYDEIKHLLIDEMQDYTAVQYAVLARVFSCKKTILGDVNQSVNPFSASNSSEIQKAFAEADCVKLCKSYRSTYEITQFAQRIQPNADLVAIERRGAEPVVMRLKSGEAELEEILRCVKEFPASGFHSMGIICKTQQQAAGLHEKLHGKGHKVHLLTSQSASFSMGITVCTAHMAKGLEFDQVIVPNATDENYSNVMDKSLLYVACTRAMHRLTITCVNRMTAFIRPRES